MDESARYYQLPLWHEYLTAKTHWEHAHAEYVADPQSRARAEWGWKWRRHSRRGLPK
jgi:hypothetical protein